MTIAYDARYPSLQGRAVIVTGGASGIGEAITRAFVAQGARTGFIDLDASAGTALAAETGARFEQADLRDIDATRTAIARLQAAHGPARALVNNAARDDRHDWKDVTPEYWDERMQVNLRHYFFTIQAVAPAMVEAGGGSIINFGSISWMLGNSEYPAYATAKAAIHGLSRSFARSLGKSHIRVNTLSPGWTMTKRQKDLWLDEKGEAEMDREMCLAGRLQPEDLAAWTLFLASDDSRMATAQNFVVDGGWV